MPGDEGNGQIDAQDWGTLGSRRRIESERRPAFEADKLFYRIVACVLGATILITAVGAVVLAWNGKEAPQVLVALGSAAIGALAGVLVQNNRR